MSEMRRCEKKDATGQWVDVAFRDLKKGDVFRLFEPDGRLVDGDEEVTAASDAYETNGVWSIQCDGLKAEEA
jgi:hypothetical protein